MESSPILPLTHDSPTLRQAGRAELAQALEAGRRALLKLADAYRNALGAEMRVDYSPEVNLPLWELGHIGWFEEYWTARNPCLAQGASAEIERFHWKPSRLPGADELYNSSRVAHATRWQLSLPGWQQTLDYLAAVRTDTLSLLATAGPDDDSLYFFRLAFFHEAMHREAWIYMAQTLNIDLAIERTGSISPTDGEVAITGGRFRLGYAGQGFAFDNELGAHFVDVPPYSIDRSALSWRRYLPFVEAGGYDDARCWTEAGWAWRERQAQTHPRYLRHTDHGWQEKRMGRWNDLDESAPAIHLTAYEAEAWCRWAGRRLPSEAEWEMAACVLDSRDFEWGSVWEWTASRFEPYPQFVAHPYRDYSAPWFDGRPVLRGASMGTDPSMRFHRYRNFFTPERNDIFAGFRSCAA